MKKIGIVASKEFFAIEKILGVEKIASRVGSSIFTIHRWERQNSMRSYEIYAINAEIGEISAAAATQALIDSVKDLEFIVNFGMAHPLQKFDETPKIAVVDAIVHYDFDVTQCNKNAVRGEYPWNNCNVIDNETYWENRIRRGANKIFQDKVDQEFNKEKTSLTICASGDTFVVEDDAKASLRLSTGAAICDMNSAGTLLTCRANNVPCLILKGITDGIHNGATRFDTRFDADATQSFKQALNILDFLT